MTIPDALLLLAALLCVVTAVIHSVAGEKRLIAPMLADRSGVLASPLARQVIRFAWHWTTALWVTVGALLVAQVRGDIDLPWLILLVGAVHLSAGIADAFMTRGRHIGWPFITAIGALALTSIFLKQ